MMRSIRMAFLCVGLCLVSPAARAQDIPSDYHLYVIYNVGTQLASIAPSNPPQVRETRFAITWTYSWQP